MYEYVYKEEDLEETVQRIGMLTSQNVLTCSFLQDGKKIWCVGTEDEFEKCG